MRTRRLRRRVAASFGDPDALESREREIAARIRRLTGQFAEPRVPENGLGWPLRGRISSSFGDRFGRFHTGIDVAAPTGTPVAAAAGGSVVIAELLPELGNTMVVDHGAGCTTLYAHLREMIVNVGDTVARDHTIGHVGATGRTTGPHLHFETRLDATPCDPTSVLPPEGDPSGTLRTELMQTFGELLDGVREVVLVGSPLHTNAGDSLIWLGQLSLLAELGISISTVVHPATYDRRPFDAAPPDAAVLLSGGGNFGDLWPFVHAHREWVFREITDRRVVQMPQSMHFLDDDALRSTQTALEGRDNVVLTWRDNDSEQAAQQRFPQTRSTLAPDIAFGRRPPATPLVGSTPILCIARSDREGRELAAASTSDVQLSDWSVRSVDRAARDALWLTARLHRRAPWLLNRRLAIVPYNRSALLTTAGAARLVASARVVVSDRLHAHVLCTMLGVPHVMLDSGYGKIESFLQTWPVTGDLVELASSPADAFERARRLLQLRDNETAVG